MCIYLYLHVPRELRGGIFQVHSQKVSAVTFFWSLIFNNLGVKRTSYIFISKSKMAALFIWVKHCMMPSYQLLLMAILTGANPPTSCSWFSNLLSWKALKSFPAPNINFRGKQDAASDSDQTFIFKARINKQSLFSKVIISCSISSIITLFAHSTQEICPFLSLLYLPF